METRNATALNEGRRPIWVNRPDEFGRTPESLMIDEPWTVACTRDPERWTTAADDGAKALCRACTQRWSCAQEACKTPGAEGLWAGILIPAAGRGRQFALKQLRSLAEHNGLSFG